MAESGKRRYAVVALANEKLRSEIAKQLDSNGFKVVLATKDEKKGVENFEGTFHDHLVYHEFDAANMYRMEGGGDFAEVPQVIKDKFGKIDVLVYADWLDELSIDDQLPFRDAAFGSDELTSQWIQKNYHETKIMVENFISLLELSDSPTIINISSSIGKLKDINIDWAKGVLSDVENVTEEKIDEVVNTTLTDFIQGSSEIKGFPATITVHALANRITEAYTSVLSKKYPSFCIKSVSPDSFQGDLISLNPRIVSSVQHSAETLLKDVLHPKGSPSMSFF